jgi:hypothetical protein
MEFLRMWGDKCLMVFLFLVCLSVGVYAFHVKEPDLASTVVDLAKQILAGLLTLLVAARAATTIVNGGKKNGSPNVVVPPVVDVDSPH